MFTFLYPWMPRRSAGYADGNEAVFYANGVEFYRAWHGRTSVAQRHKRLKHNGYYIYIHHDIIYLWIVDSYCHICTYTYIYYIYIQYIYMYMYYHIIATYMDGNSQG